MRIPPKGILPSGISLLAMGFICSCGLLLSALASTGSPPSSTGKIIVVQLQGTVKKAGTIQQNTVSQGEVIQPGDTIEVENLSSAALACENGSAMQLRANSKLEIVEFNLFGESEENRFPNMSLRRARFKLRLLSGELVGDTGKMNQASILAIESSYGVIELDARTTFRLYIPTDSRDDDLSFQLGILAGRATYVAHNSGASVSVDSGRQLVFDRKSEGDPSGKRFRIEQMDSAASEKIRGPLLRTGIITTDPSEARR